MLLEKEDEIKMFTMKCWPGTTTQRKVIKLLKRVKDYSYRVRLGELRLTTSLERSM